MLCLSCALPARVLCEPCRQTLRPVPPRRVAGVVAEAAFLHRDAAANLVRNMKYRRSLPAARFLARAMAESVSRDATVLIPVPRALVRRVTYGIDPSHELANELAVITGLPVLHALKAPIWWPRRAGAPRSRRGRVVFSSIGGRFDHSVLVDDVLTSGATMESAIDALEGADISVVTATAAGTMESGAVSHTGHGGGLRRSEE